MRSVFLFCLVVSSASASVQLPPIVVTQSRLVGSEYAQTASTTVLTRKDILASSADTLSQLLTRQSGLQVRELFGAEGNRATLDMRGFGASGGNNVLLLLNGRRLNDIDLAAADLSTIALNTIEYIEIIRGAGGVRYGDGATGGVINIVTQRTIEGDAEETLLADYADIRLGGYGGVAVSMGAQSNVSGVDMHVSKSNGYRSNSESRNANVVLNHSMKWRDSRLRWQLGADKQQARLPGERRVDSANNIDEFGLDPQGTAKPNDYGNKQGAYQFLSVERHLNNSVNYVVDLDWRWKRTQAFFDDYAFGGAFANYVDTRLGNVALTPRLVWSRSLFADAGKLDTGLEFSFSDYWSERSQNKTNSISPIHKLDVERTSIAAFVADSWRFSSWTNIVTGWRYQAIRMTAKDSADTTAPGGAFASEAADMELSQGKHMLDAGISHDIKPGVSAYAHMSRNVRFATVDEIFELDPNLFFQVFSPLKPQVSHGIDLGVKLGWPKQSLDVAIYGMNLRDEIHFDPSNFTNRNLDPTRRYGLELQWQASFGDWRLDTNYTFSRSIFRSGIYAGNDVPLVPKHSGGVSLAWEPSEVWRWQNDWQYVGSKRFDNDQTNTFALIPEYGLWDTEISYRRKNWQTTLSVKNVLDESYFSYGVRSTASNTRYNAYPLPGRAIWLGVRVGGGKEGS